MKAHIKQISKNENGEFKIVLHTTDKESEQMRVDDVEITQKKFQQKKIEEQT